MSKIQWTERTWNPVIGCTKVSEGCRNCYAMHTARRMACIADNRSVVGGRENTDRMRAYREVVKRGDLGVPLPQWNNEVRCIDAALPEPLGWKKPAMVFVNSMSDLFHEAVPFEFIDKVFAVMALCPHLTFQVLTKRPERMAEYLGSNFLSFLRRKKISDAIVKNWSNFRNYPNPDPAIALRSESNWPLPNVWLGTSAEDQATADQRIPHLLRCPAAVRFLSCEPLLGPIRLEHYISLTAENSGVEHYTKHGWAYDDWTGEFRGANYLAEEPAIAWIIVGGESGPGARPCDVAWIRSIVQQGKDAGVPVFVKQLGAVVGMSHPTGDEVREWGNTEIVEAEDGVRLMLRDRKGGDPGEWPGDLCVREFPEGVTA